ncbi:hypothetical protein MNBD_GAMMA22-1056 [hydrothermal vent metagenome]|uniref:SbsA Ig-like domain-containing protein n=1 Tax=hydrothermal vent metagenome TaxID=652676 RepID=A0A3B1AJC9_9ZZZZ
MFKDNPVLSNVLVNSLSFVYERADGKLQTIALVTFVTILLSACGGAKSSTTSVSDITGPVVIDTTPVSEELILTTDTISIRFNEAIEPNSIATDRISIFPYDSNGVFNSSKQFFLRNTDLVLSDDNTVLNIRVGDGTLQDNTIYKIRIANVTDVTGNTMLGVCEWQFSIGVVIDNNRAGVCSAEIGGGPPAPLENVIANAGGGFKVTVSWDVPLSGLPNYYIIEESIGNSNNFNIVNNNYIGNRSRNRVGGNVNVERGVRDGINFDNVVFGEQHFYRITAVNSYGKSIPVASNSITTREALKNGVSARNEIESPSERSVSTSQSQPAITLSPDGTTLAIADDLDKPTGSTLETGRVLIYTRTIFGWDFQYELVPSQLVDRIHFGSAIAFSPDGKTLAVGISRPNNTLDMVQLFNRVGLDWNTIPTYGFMLQANRNRRPWENNAEELLFSPDGLTLAVSALPTQLSAVSPDPGVVQLFQRSGADWNVTAPTRGLVLTPTSVNIGNSNYFGEMLAFSPDSQTIAVTEQWGDSELTGDTDVGLVHLFQRNGADWITAAPLRGPILQSKSPKRLQRFGSYGVAFSPDGKTIAITADESVQLFSKVNMNWLNQPTQGQTLVSQRPLEGGFGKSLAFSNDNNFIAVGVPTGDIFSIPMEDGLSSGYVQLFIRSGTDWTQLPRLGSILIAQKPRTGDRFGKNVLFSSEPADNTLVVGGRNNLLGLRTGRVSVFESFLLVN